MHKIASYIVLAFLLLTAGNGRVQAEEKLPQRLQQLTDKAYRAYSARETENYFETVEKVKQATEFSQYQETYNRACAYEAHLYVRVCGPSERRAACARHL